MLLEIDEVFVHAALLVAPDEPADGIHPEQHGGVEDLDQEVALLLARCSIVMQQVVEVGEVGEANAARRHCRRDALGARCIERAAQVERVRDRIEHGLGRHIALRGVQRRRQLNVTGAELAAEGQPVLDGAVRIGITHVTRRQFLERRREHAHVHELRCERSCGHLD